MQMEKKSDQKSVSMEMSVDQTEQVEDTDSSSKVDLSIVKVEVYLKEDVDYGEMVTQHCSCYEGTSTCLLHNGHLTKSANLGEEESQGNKDNELFTCVSENELSGKYEDQSDRSAADNIFVKAEVSSDHDDEVSTTCSCVGMSSTGCLVHGDSSNVVVKTEIYFDDYDSARVSTTCTCVGILSSECPVHGYYSNTVGNVGGGVVKTEPKFNEEYTASSYNIISDKIDFSQEKFSTKGNRDTSSGEVHQNKRKRLNDLIDGKIKKQPKVVKCHLCDFSTSSFSQYKAHQQTHEGELLYKCNLCDYRTTYVGGLRAHQVTHQARNADLEKDIWDYLYKQAARLDTPLEAQSTGIYYMINIFMLRQICPELSGLLSFEHPSILLFYFMPLD